MSPTLQDGNEKIFLKIRLISRVSWFQSHLGVNL